MSQTYQDAVESLKTVMNASPALYSVDDGRELDFDTKKKHEWPRGFIRTEESPITGGQGSVMIYLNFTLLCMGKVKKDRSDIVEVMSAMHTALTNILATLNQQQLIYTENDVSLQPLYDYHDTLSSGWQVAIQVPMSKGYECYTVPT